MDTTTTALVPSPSNLLPAVTPTPTHHPVAAYLAGMAAGSRGTQARACEALARLATDGRCDARTFPWASLDFAATSALRERVAEAYAVTTANRLLSALRGVLRACWRLGLMDGDTYHRAADVKAVRGSRLPAGRMVTSGEAVALFATVASDAPLAVRDRALLALGYGLGLRRAELVGLDVDDFDLTTGELKVSGKGAKVRLAFVTHGVRKALDAWLAVRGMEPGPLLLAVRKNGTVVAGRRLTPQAVLVVLRRRAGEARLTSCSPHDLRRAFVSTLLEQGTDLSTVARLAGHADVRTTARYDRRPDEAARRAVAALHVPV